MCALRPAPRQFTVNVALSDIEPLVAVIVTFCDDDTTEVAIVNVALLLPGGTVTTTGTDATRTLLDFRATATLVCAGPDKVTVPVALLPPLTCVGDTETLCSTPAACGLTVNVAVAEPAVP